MSLGIAFKGPEGIVLAADSRVTLTIVEKGKNKDVQRFSTFDNATKLLRVNGQDFTGVRYFRVVSTCQPCDRIQQNHHILTVFHHTLGFFDHHLSNLNVSAGAGGIAAEAAGGRGRCDRGAHRGG